MKEHIDISHLSGYRTPAWARYFIEYDGSNVQELQEATLFAQENNLPILTISGGKNLLLAFDDYPGLVISNISQGYNLSGVVLTAASGEPLWELAEKLENIHGIDLWHRFLGLPGSIGGAIFGNAGCFGLDIWPYVAEVLILNTKTGEKFTKTGTELNFSYRWSECKNHPEWFLLSVICDVSTLRERYSSQEDPLAWREKIQPEGLSCWSFFKNPSREQTAGLLIEKAGFKWYHHGGAYFSEKHANFLMSDGTATWQDLTELVSMAQAKILEQFHLQLEPEVRIIR